MAEGEPVMPERRKIEPDRFACGSPARPLPDWLRDELRKVARDSKLTVLDENYEPAVDSGDD